MGLRGSLVDAVDKLYTQVNKQQFVETRASLIGSQLQVTYMQSFIIRTSSLHSFFYNSTEQSTIIPYFKIRFDGTTYIYIYFRA